MCVYGLTVGILGVLGASGCAAAPDSGQLDVALTNVPAGAACVEVAVTSSRKDVRRFDLGVAQKASFSISRLPFGIATVTADAFSADCRHVSATATPSAYGEQVTATIRPGATTLAVLPMIGNGHVTLTTHGARGHDAP